MARAPSVAGILDIRSIGVLVQHHKSTCTHVSEAARRVVYEENTLMYGQRGLPAKSYPCSECGCFKNGVPYNGSGSIFGEAWTPLGRCRCPETGYGLGLRMEGGGGTGYGPVSGLADDENPGKFDRMRDWAIAFGTSIIIGSVLGLINSYGIFVPAIQANYTIGMMEAVLVGCLCYMVLILLLPLSVIITKRVGSRWAGVFGMILFFLGICLDALVLHVSTLYVSHVLLMGIGGSIAYCAAVSINSDHFRRYMKYAYCLNICAPCLGTIIFYYLSSLMLNYVSYQWTKFCLALIFLLCTAACQTFPRKARNFPWSAGRAGKNRVKECVNQCINEDPCVLEEETPEKKSYMCVCVCDVSCWSDYSFLLWAVVSMLALSAIYVPYLFLMAYALNVGTDYSLAILCWFCITSLLTRLALILSEWESFIFYRTLFQIACIVIGSLNCPSLITTYWKPISVSGIMYIILVWVDTFGWTVIWSLFAGAVEGIIVFCIPVLTLKTCPMKSVGAYWSWVVIFHAFAVIIGPMVMMSVYYNSGEYGPGYIAIGVAQIIAGLLAILLPNEDEDYGGGPVVGGSRAIDADYSAGTRPAPYTITRSSGCKYSASSRFNYSGSGNYSTKMDYPSSCFHDTQISAYPYGNGECRCNAASKSKSQTRGRKPISSDDKKKERSCSWCSNCRKDSPKKNKDTNQKKGKKEDKEKKAKDKGTKGKADVKRRPAEKSKDRQNKKDDHPKDHKEKIQKQKKVQRGDGKDDKENKIKD